MAVELLTNRAKTSPNGVVDSTTLNPPWFEQIRTVLGYGGPYKGVLRSQSKALSRFVIFPAMRNADPAGDAVALNDPTMMNVLEKFTPAHMAMAGVLYYAYGQVIIAWQPDADTADSDVIGDSGAADPYGACGPGGCGTPVGGLDPFGRSLPEAAAEDAGTAADGPGRYEHYRVHLSWTANNDPNDPAKWKLAPDKVPGGAAVDTRREGTRIGRVWNPDYLNDPDAPDSPTRDALNDLELLSLLNANVAASCRNRVHGRGMWAVPSDCTVAGPGGQDGATTTSGSVADELYRAMNAPLTGGASSTAASGVVVEASSESLAGIKHIAPVVPMDQRIPDLMDIGLRNVATTADYPPNLLIESGGPHWDAFLSAESTVNVNLSAVAEDFLEGFCEIVMRPIARQMAEAGQFPYGDPEDLVIGISTRRLSSRYGSKDPLSGFLGKSLDDIADVDELRLLIVVRALEKGLSPEETAWYSDRVADLWEARRKERRAASR